MNINITSQVILSAVGSTTGITDCKTVPLLARPWTDYWFKPGTLQK